MIATVIDPTVGYARGSILSSSAAEMLRLEQAGRLIRARVARFGEASIGIFTGNRRDVPLRADDLSTLAEEWIGSALFEPALADAIRSHLDAPDGSGTAVFNRGSAALVAAVLALAPRGCVVSMAPAGDRSHPSARRGAALADASFFEVTTLEELEPLLPGASLLIVTSVASSLATMSETDIGGSIAAARRHGVPALVDDAYGARLRPVIHGGVAALQHGADLVMTNADKAGLHGPRAGFVAGDPALVARVAGRAAELGLEARAPIALGVLRGLQAWAPDDLRREAADGEILADALIAGVGAGVAHRTALGPIVLAEDALSLACARAGGVGTDLAPVEATALLGMILLRDAGILTTNALGRPGAHPALRLKPTGDALGRCGGAQAVVGAVVAALDGIATLIDSPDRVRALLLGPG